MHHCLASHLTALNSGRGLQFRTADNETKYKYKICIVRRILLIYLLCKTLINLRNRSAGDIHCLTYIFLLLFTGVKGLYGRPLTPYRYRFSVTSSPDVKSFRNFCTERYPLRATECLRQLSLKMSFGGSFHIANIPDPVQDNWPRLLWSPWSLLVHIVAHCPFSAERVPETMIVYPQTHIYIYIYMDLLHLWLG